MSDQKQQAREPAEAMREDTLAERVVDSMMKQDHFSQWLGIVVLDVQPGSVVLEMTVREEMVNGFGVGHGAIAFALADTALAFAANSHGRVSVSIENSIAYPKPVHAGDVLVATAEEQSLQNRVATYEVKVRKRADNTLVGIFRGTVYRTDKGFFMASDPGERV